MGTHLSTRPLCYEPSAFFARLVLLFLESIAMTLRTSLPVFALAATLAASVGVVVACGSSSDEAPAPTDTGAGTQPPVKPQGAAADTSTRQTFALRKLYLGESDRSGKADGDAWKKYGYDLDKVKTSDSNKLGCVPPDKNTALEKRKPIADGDNGIDNAFGKEIVPLLGSIPQIGRESSRVVSQALEDGSFTVMLDIRGLTSDPNQTNTGLKGQLFAGGTFSPETDGGVKPSWNGTDNWPVRPELLVGGNVDESRIKFDDSYVTGGLWVSSQEGSTVELTLSFSEVSFTLAVHKAVITAKHSAADKLTEGTVAGFISLAELKDTLGKLAPRLAGAQACPPNGSLYKLLNDTLPLYADMRTDGATTGECDAISIALGFDAAQIGNPAKKAEAATSVGVDPCAPDGG